MITQGRLHEAPAELKDLPVDFENNRFIGGRFIEFGEVERVIQRMIDEEKYRT